MVKNDIPNTGLQHLLIAIVKQISAYLHCDRTTLFLHSAETNELWSAVAEGEGLSEIRIRADVGIAGSVMQSGESVNITDAYTDSRFDRSVDAKTGYRTKTILALPVVAPDGKRLGVVQALNKDGGVFGADEEHLLAALAAQAAISITNARLSEALHAQAEREQLLNEELQDQHRRLQEAFRAAEASQNRLQGVLDRIRILRRFALLFILLLVCIGTLVAQRGMLDRILTGSGGATSGVDAAALGLEDSAFANTVPETVTSTVVLTGRLAPLETVTVVSPISGRLQDKRFAVGGAVESGQVLFTLDTTEYESKLRLAEGAQIRAQANQRKIENWASGPEVGAARRAVEGAKREHSRLTRIVKGSELLLKEGIIPARQHEELVLQVGQKAEEVEVLGAAVEAVLERGNSENRRLAQLELDNAAAALTEIKDRIANREVRAPISGVVLMPPDRDARHTIDRGSNLDAGSPVLTIGAARGFAIDTHVDERKVHRLALGQAVLVTASAFPRQPLTGKITAVSSQARANAQGRSGSAVFDVRVTVTEIPPALQNRILVGMTASLEVEVYRNDNATVVPITAVEVVEGRRLVYRRTAEGEIEPVEIETGVTTSHTVEVLSGLRPGDAVLMEPQHAVLTDSAADEEAEP
jgi:multidrug efflux pump subunit AcrA (membrane-fusion protein)/putative methionine-R-sulfoxide reductase with GAF domain